AGTVDDLHAGVDGDAGAYGDGSGVRGWGVDLHLAAVDVQVEGGEEGVVSEVGDADLFHAAAKLLDEGEHEVVRLGARDADVLEFERDGVCDVRADPDGDVAIRVLFLQDDDAAVVPEADADGIDDEFAQGAPPGPRRTLCLYPLASARWVRSTGAMASSSVGTGGNTSQRGDLAWACRLHIRAG